MSSGQAHPAWVCVVMMHVADGVSPPCVVPCDNLLAPPLWLPVAHSAQVPGPTPASFNSRPIPQRDASCFPSLFRPTGRLVHVVLPRLCSSRPPLPQGSCHAYTGCTNLYRRPVPHACCPRHACDHREVQHPLLAPEMSWRAPYRALGVIWRPRHSAYLPVLLVVSSVRLGIGSDNFHTSSGRGRSCPRQQTACAQRRSEQW